MGLKWRGGSGSGVEIGCGVVVGGTICTLYVCSITWGFAVVFRMHGTDRQPASSGQIGRGRP